ncbi:MAG: sugar phosphate isomerase/epimerase [Planctomycetes bacterium]|nr:sugar phosphate isomerase/epimerase [Planctomycetota bacterium]
MKQLPFRIGTTSYIVPDEILPNVHFLADQVDDIELVLFEIDDGSNNLPDGETIRELKKLAQQHQLTYTIHLPLDLRLAVDGGEQHISIVKARKVIESTLDLNPWAYVLHLDGREILNNTDPVNIENWNRHAVRALEIVTDLVQDGSLLAVENLEKYPLNFWDEVFKRSSISRCIDIGHLWYDGHDPVPYLEKHINRARVLHIHGIAERDHKSLSNVPINELEQVINFILQSSFKGVMTIEVFGEKDFKSSMTAIQDVIDRLSLEGLWEKE